MVETEGSSPSGVVLLLRLQDRVEDISFGWKFDRFGFRCWFFAVPSNETLALSITNSRASERGSTTMWITRWVGYASLSRYLFTWYCLLYSWLTFKFLGAASRFLKVFEYDFHSRMTSISTMSLLRLLNPALNARYALHACHTKIYVRLIGF